MAEWRDATDKTAFQKRLIRNIARATKLNALAAQKKMREVIQSGDFKANAPLTVALKGSSKPLVAGGDLFQSITSEEINDDEIFVGVLRSADGGYDVVDIVHNGATIPVTPAMRWMFMLLAKASEGKMDPGKLEGRAAELFSQFQGWKPLAPSTTAILIPARPFAVVTFNSPDLIKLCQDNWAAAVQAAMYPPKKEPEGALSKLSKKLERKTNKLAKKASKLGKKAAKYGKKAGKFSKKYGKKGLKATKRFGKKAGRAGKRFGKNASRKAKRFGKKAVRGAKRGFKKFTKRGGKGRKK
jgi:hypothetical protein